MNSKTIISLEELSQILAAARIFPSHKEYILVAAKNLSTYLEILEGPKFPELQKYFPCQSTKKAKRLGTTSDAERSLRPEIKEFSTCNSKNPSTTTKQAISA